MRVLDKELENRKVDSFKLLEFGFIKCGNDFIYERFILDGKFKMVVKFGDDGKMVSKLIEVDGDDEYLLVDSNVSGEFIGEVKSEYDCVLKNIIDKCTNYDVFKSEQALKIIKYVKDKYGDELEYLWKKFPKNAVWRAKVNGKWYGAMLVVEEGKLGINSSEIIEILDVRSSNISNLVDNKKYFSGYHMNKKNWLTVKLDGSLKIEEVYKLIDESYDISLKK